MNRIILYVGMVYNFFCAGITANLIASNHKIGTLLLHIKSESNKVL